MGEVVYTSQVMIEREKGPNRLAWLPAEEKPVRFGVHGAVAEHYGVDPDDYPPIATTLDYVVAAAGGGLTGTFGGALEARGIDASGKRLTADVIGEVEDEDGVLIIRRIHVVYQLKASSAEHETIERVHRAHARYCPVARSLEGAIEITTEYQLEET